MTYTPWCNTRGMLVDDGTIARLGEHEFRLTSAESNWRWLTDAADGFAVTIADEIGPTVSDVATPYTPPEDEVVGLYAFRTGPGIFV